MNFKNKKLSDFKKKLFQNFSSSHIAKALNPINLEFKGNNEAIIEGFKTIEEYDENMVKLKSKKMTIIFFGNNLEVKCISFDSIIVSGTITSVNFN